MHDPMSQLAIAGISTWVMEWMKRKEWVKFVSPESANKVQRGVSVVIALLASAGIAFTFDGDTGTLTIAGLTVANGIHFLWDAFQQFFLQHSVYHGIVKK